MKNRKDNDVKEIRFTPLTDTHDLQTKANQAIKMLDQGKQLKVAIFLKGRLITRLDTAELMMNKFIEMIGDHGTVDKAPVLEGKNYFCSVSPKSKK